MTGIMADQDHRRRALLLTAVALVSIGLWQTQIGSLALYPFTILATWFHEMGHGLMAMITGSTFDNLVIYADGSGMATSLRSHDAGRLTGALIAASGPIGPALAGALLIMASRTTAGSRLALEILGWALIVSTVIWVRSMIGWIILPGLGLGIIALERLARPSLHRLAVQVLGVQAAISAWRQFDYLFSAGGVVGGEMHRSDTGAIADALLLPYWFWGAAISIGIVALLWWSVRTAFKRDGL